MTSTDCYMQSEVEESGLEAYFCLHRNRVCNSVVVLPATTTRVKSAGKLTQECCCNGTDGTAWQAWCPAVPAQCGCPGLDEKPRVADAHHHVGAVCKYQPCIHTMHIEASQIALRYDPAVSIGLERWLDHGLFVQLHESKYSSVSEARWQSQASAGDKKFAAGLSRSYAQQTCRRNSLLSESTACNAWQRHCIVLEHSARHSARPSAECKDASRQAQDDALAHAPAGHDAACHAHHS